MTQPNETGQLESGDSGGSTGRNGGQRIRQLSVAVIFGLVYWRVIRPWMLNWGATASEVNDSLPGDEVLPDADAESTMAITIGAPPEDIWPWLRQLGQEQGGFYSYEWAENLVGLDIHNADQIVAQWQDISEGDTVRLGRADWFPDATLEVAELAPERSMVLVTPGDSTGWVWSFVLKPINESESRLLVRSRIRLPTNRALRVAVQLILDPVTFIMTRAMLIGIRSRVESRNRERTLSVVSE